MTNTIANTILNQLGGNRFCAMTGAKNLLDHGDALSFKVGRGAAGGINYVKVVLAADDTYTVEFWKVAKRGLDVRKLHEVDGVYAADLRRCFEGHTGFATSL